MKKIEMMSVLMMTVALGTGCEVPSNLTSAMQNQSGQDCGGQSGGQGPQGGGQSGQGGQGARGGSGGGQGQGQGSGQGQGGSGNCNGSGQGQGGQGQGGQGQGQGPSQDGGQRGFTGTPFHLQYDETKYYVVANVAGMKRTPDGRPFQEGDHLKEVATAPAPLDQAYAEVFEVIAPISDVLKYAPESVTRAEWQTMTTVLADYGILTHPGIYGNPQVPTLSNDEALDCSLHGAPTQVISQYLFEAELALKCYHLSETHVSVDLSGPDGRDFCWDVLRIDTR
jgi:hypothetical protein